MMKRATDYAIDWQEDWDENDNSVWEGASPYQDDGTFFYWRLRQRLVNNRIEWYADHDAECCGGSSDDTFGSLKNAKDAVQHEHDQIIESAEDE